MPGDSLDLLSPAELQDRVRELSSTIAAGLAREGELRRDLVAANQLAESARRDARDARVALERELATSNLLREERGALQRTMEAARGEVAAALQQAHDARQEATSLRGAYRELEDRNRGYVARLEAVRELSRRLTEALA